MKDDKEKTISTGGKETLTRGPAKKIAQDIYARAKAFVPIVIAVFSLSLISSKNVKASGPMTSQATSLAGLWKNERGSMVLISFNEDQAKDYQFKMFTAHPNEEMGTTFFLYLQEEEKPGYVLAEVADDLDYSCGTIEFKRNSNTLLWDNVRYVRDAGIANKLLSVLQHTNVEKAKLSAKWEVDLAISQQQIAERIKKDPWLVGEWGRTEKEFTIREDGSVLFPGDMITFILMHGGNNGETIFELVESQYVIDWNKKTVSSWEGDPLKKIK